MKKVSVKNMKLTFGNKQKRDLKILAPKINRPTDRMLPEDLPITGGNGLDGYILDVMVLK